MSYRAPVSGPTNAPAAPAERPLRVLARPAFSNRRDNPYNYLLYRELAALGAEVTEFSLARAFFGRFEVFHVHWPEVTFNTAPSLASARLQAALFSRAIDVQRRRGAKLVWTVHNLRSHEKKYPEAEERFWQSFVPRVDAVISLTASALDAAQERFPALKSRPSFVVPHQHYRGEYADTLSRVEARARLGIPPNAHVVTSFGRVVAYKNLPALVACFRDLLPTAAQEPPLRLVIAGRPRTEALERELYEASAGDPRIVLALSRIPSDDAQIYLRAADLVALPYRDILNSGSAVLALSFDRPVFMPEGPAARDLQSVAGADWIFAYDSLTPQSLSAALHAALGRADRPEGSHLERLAPRRVATLTLDAYRTLCGASVLAKRRP